jgi:hypothetical protein
VALSLWYFQFKSKEIIAVITGYITTFDGADEQRPD